MSIESAGPHSASESAQAQDPFGPIVDREPVGVAVLEAVGESFVYVYVNPTLQDRKPALPMRGKRFDEVWPEQSAFLPALRRVLETGEPTRAENVTLDAEAAPGEQSTRRFAYELSRLETPEGPYVLQLSVEVKAATASGTEADVEAKCAELLEAEREARQQARRELETTRQILAAARTLASVLDLPVLLDQIVRSLLAASGAGRVVLNLWNPDRSEFVVAASAGRGKAPIGRAYAFERFARPTRDAVTGQRTVVVDYDPVPTEEKRYPLELKMRVALFVPLIGRGQMVGFVSLDDPGDRREFSAREREVAEGVAAEAATAIQNARLLEAECDRARLEHSTAEISADLASSLDVDETLPTMLSKMCRELSCRGAAVADRVEGGWRIRHAVGLPPTPFKAGFFASDEETPASGTVLRTEEPLVCQDCSKAANVNRELARLGGYEAYAVHPLIIRDVVIGVLAVFFAEPRTLSTAELGYLSRVAFATSLAEENSRLYAAEHRIAETLQTALLALPDRIPGVEFAHMYRSATDAARVGGDFYDIFELEHEMVGITVGDISGHGIDAAVLMSLVKNAIRVQATQQDKKPDEVVAAASQLLYENSPTEIFATAFFGVIHLDTGVLEYCSAGHPVGALMSAEDGVHRLDNTGPLIGAFPHQEFGMSTDTVANGDLLFLYTDGLTEARAGNERFGEERLFELLADERGNGPDAVLRHILGSVMAFADGRLTDDLAIMAVRPGGVQSVGADEPLHAAG